MPVPPDDHDAAPLAVLSAARARQWRQAALALAFLFASLPLAGKLFLGSWRFDSALEIASLCLFAAAYFHFAAREGTPEIPDSAAILGEALRLAESGDTGRALALLDESLRLNPGLWQALQYRGQMLLGEPAAAEAALADFTEAIRLAPNESHLYVLRSYAFAALGQDSLASADLKTAARLE